MDPRIADYIRANRGRYTREAIRQQLIEAGHDPADVDATWAALETPDPDAVAGEGFWGRFALIVVGVNLAVFLLVGFATGMLQGLPGGGMVIAVIFAVALVLGALISWGLVALTGPTRMSPTTAIVIGAGIPFLFALIIGGSCYALLGAVGGPPPPSYSGVMEIRVDPPLGIGAAADATCQPAGQRTADGFSVHASFVGPEGRQVNVSVNAHQPAPGAPLEPMLFIMSEQDPPMGWASEGQPANVELEATADGLSGSLTFEDVPPVQIEGPQDLEGSEPISGVITWTCE